LIGRRFRDATQLSNKPAIRKTISYLYLTLVGITVTFVDALTWKSDTARPDPVIEVLFLMVAVAVLGLGDVRLDRGRLTLSGLAVGSAAILLNPLDATIVGLAIAIPMRTRGAWPIVGNAVLTAALACLGAVVATQLRVNTDLSLVARVAVLVIVNAAGLVLVPVALSIRTGESLASIIRHSFSTSLNLAYAYFGLAALLISYVLDGSPLGYLLATIVCILALALTDTIAGRRVRQVLESELSDADRHLFHSRAVEGVVHNLRNHMATATGYLNEIDSRRLDPVVRESIETATAAANDAVTVLTSLAQGATPRVSYAPHPVDLNDLITRALGMARPRARTKEVQLALRESPEEVEVRADPLLLREVITNLVNNAIDAAPLNGHVELKAGRRGNGWPYFSVSDDGPGVSDENRHHLFEPHFTTKEGGTGLGLFMSFGIVKEHQGDLIYSGSSRGAVFTVVLPPFAG
jgi:signal transduction histidine kinase